MANQILVCPYCGNNMKIDLKPGINPETICEVCGSSIESEVQQLIKTSKSILSKSEFDAPFKSNSEPVTPFKRPLTQDQSIQSQAFPDQNIDMFPKSQLIRPQQSKSSPNITVHQALKNFGSVKPPTRGAYLLFPQFNQKILITPNTQVFHFGRNTILNLLGPTQEYDLEWLNSISRVQKDNRNQVIKQHFIIHKEKNHFFIEDITSSWGTWLNGRQIKGLGKIPIKDGDKIELKMAKPGVNKIMPFFIQIVL